MADIVAALDRPGPTASHTSLIVAFAATVLLPHPRVCVRPPDRRPMGRHAAVPTEPEYRQAPVGTYGLVSCYVNEVAEVIRVSKSPGQAESRSTTKTNKTQVRGPSPWPGPSQVELQYRVSGLGLRVERVTGIEPALLAWEANQTWPLRALTCAPL
jgi:hypothetical protein